MKINLKKVIFVIALIMLLNMTCISANELNNCTLDLNDYDFESNLNLNDNESLSKAEYLLNGGTFEDIQNLVDDANSGDTLILNGEYVAVSNSSIVNINKKLTITSDSGATLNGNDLSGIFYLRKSSNGSVIQGLKFINGNRTLGSAIFIATSDIVINNCLFENNSAYAYGGGGAIGTSYDLNKSANLLVTDCKFINNKAPVSSGALAAYGYNSRIINCLFDGNYGFKYMNYSSFEGAVQIGMNKKGSKGFIGNCTFINNYVESNNGESFGGATGIRNGTIIENSSFINNNADYGGAIIYYSSGNVKNCIFDKNSAVYGGAISNKNSNENNLLFVSNSYFQNNHAELGGSIYIDFGCELKITHSSFKNNFAQYGGVIYSNSSKMQSSQSNFVENYASNDGGVIYSNGEIILLQSNFTVNHATCGGAIYSFSNLILNESQFINNWVSKFGGAVYNLGDLKSINSNFQNNKANSIISAKLSSKKNYVNCSDATIIKTSLKGGNNVLDAIWSINAVNINGVQITPNNNLSSQKIILKINGKTFVAKTDKNGIATFKFNTKNFKVKTYRGNIIFEESEDYFGNSSEINLKITKKVVYKIKIKNKKKIKTVKQYKAYLTKFYFKNVKYVEYYYDNKTYNLVGEKEGYKKVKLSKKYWKFVSKKNIETKYKWYKSKYRNVYTYKSTKITYKYVNGIYVKKYVNKNYKFKKNGKYKNKRKNDWSMYVLPSVDCESDNKLIMAKSKSIIKNEAKRLHKSVSKLTDEQKANAILKWVQKNIKYENYGNTRKGAVNTLKNKYGNCVDQSHLSIALLRSINIPAKYESKNVGSDGHTWHLAFFKGKWKAGESTCSRDYHKYGKCIHLSKFMKESSGDVMHISNYKFSSKFINYKNKWVMLFEYHYLNNNWKQYYGGIYEKYVEMNHLNLNNLSYVEMISHG